MQENFGTYYHAALFCLLSLKKAGTKHPRTGDGLLSHIWPLVRPFPLLQCHLQWLVRFCESSTTCKTADCCQQNMLSAYRMLRTLFPLHQYRHMLQWSQEKIATSVLDVGLQPWCHHNVTNVSYPSDHEKPVKMQIAHIPLEICSL